MPAPVPRDLIEVVACPKCKGKLTLKDDGTAFVCSQCRLAFAVDGGVPNFLIDEATPIA